MKAKYVSQIFQEQSSPKKNVESKQEKSIERRMYSPSSKFNLGKQDSQSIYLSIQNMKNRIQMFESPSKNRSTNLKISTEIKQSPIKIQKIINSSSIRIPNQKHYAETAKGFLRISNVNISRDQEVANKQHSDHPRSIYSRNFGELSHNHSQNTLRYSQNIEKPIDEASTRSSNAHLLINNHALKTPQANASKSTKLLLDKLANKLDCSFDWLKVKQNQSNSINCENNRSSKNLGQKLELISSPRQKSGYNESWQQLKNKSCCSIRQQNSKATCFQFGKKLGKGKFGEVFLCKDSFTGFLVAIKKFSKQKLIQYNMIQQFTHEIKLHSSLDHPNIVKFYGYYEEDKHINLVMEYMNGGTLFQYMSRMKKIPLKEAVAILADIIDAVCYIHQRSIAHRDIKPENIVLSSEGVAKLCDFGWSAVVQNSRKTYCGTFDYAAPEILEKKSYGVQVDIWCIGVLAYEILTGRVPFHDEDRKNRVDKIIHVDQNRIDFPVGIAPEAEQFIKALVQKDPSRRPKSQNLLKFKLFQIHNFSRFKKQG